MKTTKHIKTNQNGGCYINGKAYTELEWFRIVSIYEKMIENGTKCTVRSLAESAKCSRNSASRAIQFYKAGEIALPVQGTHKRGVGSLKRLTFIHHRYIYTLYLENPILHAECYVEKFSEEFGMQLSTTFITR